MMNVKMFLKVYDCKIIVVFVPCDKVVSACRVTDIRLLENNCPLSKLIHNLIGLQPLVPTEIRLVLVYHEPQCVFWKINKSVLYKILNKIFSIVRYLKYKFDALELHMYTKKYIIQKYFWISFWWISSFFYFWDIFSSAIYHSSNLF